MSARLLVQSFDLDTAGSDHSRHLPRNVQLSAAPKLEQTRHCKRDPEKC